ncbi:MAG: peptidoglycan DD-metalloendopeptidase family protein [Candidatus Eisenbacteria bacterium]|nr:peptidoglycan DD-metalloendopeptidase family protein [Candidatus Eisenbacteria bacterium]
MESESGRGFRDREYSILITPPGAGRVLRFQLKPWQVRLGMAAVAVVLAVGLIGAVLYGRIAAQARKTGALQAELQRLTAELERLDDLQAEVERLESMRREVLELTGVSAHSGRAAAGGSGKIPEADESGRVALETGELVPNGHHEREDMLDTLRAVIYVTPCRGPISRGFVRGAGNSRSHNGIDLAGSQGTWIVAAGAGVIEEAGEDEVFGKLLILDHGDDIKTLYGHNSEIYVEEGERVIAGQRIARMGSTGLSSAPHLHFEIRRAGRAVNPMLVLPTLGTG